MDKPFMLRGRLGAGDVIGLSKPPEGGGGAGGLMVGTGGIESCVGRAPKVVAG